MAESAAGKPLADALNSVIQPKLLEVGWGSGGAEDAQLSEYISLMLINGKAQDEIATELANDLLGLDSNDPVLVDFCTWAFEQLHRLNTQPSNAGENGQTVQADTMAGVSQDNASGGQDIDMDLKTDGPAELNAPTGPRAMRNGALRGSGREKRMMGHISKAMDRSSDNVLHRVRTGAGTERINTHSRAPPSGPRGGMVGRQPRGMNGRAASIAAGMAGMGAPMGPGGMSNMNGWGGQMIPGQADLMSMLEQQSHMMAQLQEQMMMQQQQVVMTKNGGQGHGKSLFDRVKQPHKGRQGSHQNGQASQQTNPSRAEPNAEGEDVDMSGAKRNPEETVCKFNLHCTNKDCKFAHQSPAAPAGSTVDIGDVCSFGAACKNRKCVGNHPSPAAKMAHQSEQDCKFYPNCQNPRCTFRHPNKPLCRNGADCSVENCPFTHISTPCKFRPCTNRYCTYKHEDGQRGTFQDKVWTADGAKPHVSERKFADTDAPVEDVIPGSENAMDHQQSMPEDLIA